MWERVHFLLVPDMPDSIRRVNQAFNHPGNKVDYSIIYIYIYTLLYCTYIYVCVSISIPAVCGPPSILAAFFVLAMFVFSE